VKIKLLNLLTLSVGSGILFAVMRDIDLKLIEQIVIDYNGSPYKDDAYVLSASWTDTGKSLTDSELDVLGNEHIDECLEKSR